MHPIDYSRSFSIGTAPSNEVRFWVESRTRLIDPDGQDEDFIQAASCKSEHTFAQSELFLADNYDFLPIFGRDHALIFRRKAFLNENYREYRNFADLWGGVRHSLVEAEVELLADPAAALRATYGNAPLIAQTEIRDDTSGRRAIIEYPVKTMNTIRATDTFQVDTGPLAYPDLSRGWERRIESLSLAFVAFNTPHFADFVIEVPTTIDDGEAPRQVHHYSQRVTHQAENRLYAQR